MRLLSTPVMWIAIAVVVGIIAYGEFLCDWRVPRSGQSANSVMAVTYSIDMADLNKLEAESKRKYGEGIQLSLEVGNETVSVTQDEKVLETHEQIKSFEGVYGMFVVDRKAPATTRFPFSIDVRQESSSLNRSVRDWFKSRFKRVPQQWFEFDDSEWTIDRCAALPVGLGLGRAGNALRLREGTACVVTWKGQQPGSMLISVSLANGDPWMRPFTRRLCRHITEAALERFTPGESGSPKYAACILVDRPAYVSAQKSLSVSVYDVGVGNALARIE
jgi:hypothetical protein